jgi:Site-specific recombinase XerD
MITMDRSNETVKGYTIELNLLNRYLSEKYNSPVYVEDITLQDLEGYLLMLKLKGHAPSSRSRVVYIIRAFYSFCYKKDYISNNVSLKLEAIPVPEKERTYLSETEMNRIVTAVQSPLIKLLLNTLYHTGMRISECLNLKVQDVDLVEEVITVRNTKGKKDRQIPIHEDLLAEFRDYMAIWRKGNLNPFFFSLNNTFKVSPDYVNKILHQTTIALNMNKHVTCHILRHSFASSLVSKNVNIVSIQKLLGHRDLSTTSVYTHTNLNELKQVVNTI